MSDQMLPLSVDWMALTLRLRSSIMGCPDGHRWAFYSPTNVWSSRWCLFNDWGDKIFTILFQPRSSVIKGDCALFEVANEWLYHGLGIRGALHLLSQCCEFDILGISRVDLAADFQPDEQQANVIKALSDGSMYIAGKRSGSGFWCTNKDAELSPMWAGLVPHCQSWGHKTSNVKWKLYYKSKELREGISGKGFNKPYIVDMWRDSGLDVANVWRLEVSLHNCNTFDYDGEKLTFERFMHTGSDLFQSLYTTRFDVRRNEGHADRTNDTHVDFLPVGRFKGAFKVHREDRIAEHSGAISLLRHLIADVTREEVLICDSFRESVLSNIATIVESGGMHKYFQMVTGQSFDSWAEWLRVQAYYFGEEHKRQMNDNGVTMERAMFDSGLCDIDPLVAETSKSPSAERDDIYARRWNRLKYLEELSNRIDVIR